MTILVTDRNRSECTFKVYGESLFIYHRNAFRAMGKLDEDIRFSDGIYVLRGDDLVLKSGSTTTAPAPAPSPAPQPGTTIYARFDTKPFPGAQPVKFG